MASMEEKELVFSKPQLMVERVLSYLRDLIIYGKLKPGDRLIELQLMKKLGTSRSPIREALRTLESEGLVNIHTRKGAFIAQICEKDLLDLFELRQLIEPYAAKVAAKRVTPELSKKFNKIADQIIKQERKQDLKGLLESAIALHDLILEATGNERLIQVYKILKPSSWRYQNFFAPISKVQGSSKEHLQIVSAILTGNGTKAENLVRKHLKHIEKSLLKAINNEDSLWRKGNSSNYANNDVFTHRKNSREPGSDVSRRARK